MYIDPDNIVMLKNVSLEYNYNDILHDITLEIELGQNACFFGPELSGLGALFPLIMGMIDNYSGEVFYRGHEIGDFDYQEALLHKKDIGYLHGEYGLISNMSVEQNISLPMEYHSRLTRDELVQKVRKLIDELNLDHCRKLRPISLTHSEILKTAYARSIIMEPDLMLVEHGFESQSPVNIHTFMSHLKQWCNRADKSVFFITYEPEKLVDFADIFVMFYNGRIVFHGSRHEFRVTDNGFVRQFLTGSDEGPMVVI